MAKNVYCDFTSKGREVEKTIEVRRTRRLEVLSGCGQKYKEKREGGRIKVTPVSVMEELGRRESKEAREKLKEYKEIWAEDLGKRRERKL